MFGVQGFSVDSFSSQGIVFLGSADLDSNFTQETSQNFISPASAEITSIFKQAAAAAGLLITEADMSANFTQTSTQTLVHQTPAQILSLIHI